MSGVHGLKSRACFGLQGVGERRLFKLVSSPGMSEPSSEQPSDNDGEPQSGGANAVPADRGIVAEASPAPPPAWVQLCSVEDIPEGDILACSQRGNEVLVYRNGQQVTCVPNECPHRGWAFDGGYVRNAVLTCPFHGYEFRLDTGECLTSPSLSLDLYPIRICDGRVEIWLK